MLRNHSSTCEASPGTGRLATAGERSTIMPPGAGMTGAVRLAARIWPSGLRGKCSDARAIVGDRNRPPFRRLARDRRSGFLSSRKRISRSLSYSEFCANGRSGLRLDPNMAPSDRIARISLHANKTGRTAALSVIVLERCCLLALASLRVGEEDRVLVALHDDFVFEPDTWDKCWTGCVVLHGGFVHV